jgi:hypothetical protein
LAQESLEEKQHADGKNKYYPAREDVEKTLCFTRIPILHEQAGDNDTEAVRKYRDRNRPQDKSKSDPRATFCYISINCSKSYQGEKGTNAATRFRHL